MQSILTVDEIAYDFAFDFEKTFACDFEKDFAKILQKIFAKSCCYRKNYVV